jgi:hypothetical protein
MTAASPFRQFANVLSSPALQAVAQHWHQVRGDRLMPTWTDLSSSVLSPYFQLLWGFHYDSGSGDFTGRLAGAHIREWLGANFWGARLRDIHPPQVADDAHRFLTGVVTIPAAGRCSGRLFTMGGRPITGERIALPLAADGRNGDGILGVSDYEHLPVSGAVELIHENVEWFAL